MYKLLLAITILFVFVSPSNAQIKIEQKDRIYNWWPDGFGYCAWCCIETLGRHHHIESLYGLAEKRTKESDFNFWKDQKTRVLTKAAFALAHPGLGLIIPDWDEPYVWVSQREGEKIVKRKAHRSPGDWIDMQNKLIAAGVKYKIQEVGNKNRDIITYAIQHKYGGMVVVNWYGYQQVNGQWIVYDIRGNQKKWENEKQSAHAMILQSYTDKEVTLYDPNLEEDLVMSWERFDYWWTGYMLVLIPEEK